MQTVKYEAIKWGEPKFDPLRNMADCTVFVGGGLAFPFVVPMSRIPDVVNALRKAAEDWRKWAADQDLDIDLSVLPDRIPDPMVRHWAPQVMATHTPPVCWNSATERFEAILTSRLGTQVVFGVSTDVCRRCLPDWEKVFQDAFGEVPSKVVYLAHARQN